ncbi:hypothetical protein F5Y16DRAFT_358375 [Xylariaceae sp. FL0255]|nr:hypothetical protein F5Y16DRAFT_358375 [Xylariaceae sp. FL0255]
MDDGLWKQLRKIIPQVEEQRLKHTDFAVVIDDVRIKDWKNVTDVLSRLSEVLHQYDDDGAEYYCLSTGTQKKDVKKLLHGDPPGINGKECSQLDTLLHLLVDIHIPTHDEFRQNPDNFKPYNIIVLTSASGPDEASDGLEKVIFRALLGIYHLKPDALQKKLVSFQVLQLGPQRRETQDFWKSLDQELANDFREWLKDNDTSEIHDVVAPLLGELGQWQGKALPEKYDIVDTTVIPENVPITADAIAKAICGSWSSKFDSKDEEEEAVPSA